MKVRNARICLNDDEVFTGETCPVCMSKTSYPLRKWLQPLEKIGGRNEKSNHALQVEPVCQCLDSSGLVRTVLYAAKFAGDSMYVVPASHAERFAKDYCPESPTAETGAGHNYGGIKMGLKGSFLKGCCGPHASDAAERKDEQGGPVLPREEHYRGDKDLKVFSEKQPEPGDSAA
jgi:hypothetical protein